ncbi:cysteine-rich protein 1 isoform X1 [Bos indicus]|uniref:Cysteine-rich protein 1 isoform X1 n=1 Tax=Bos indicus TaxID=9915 RepID=A0ABM4R8Z3_BOSIN
MPKCPKCSKEVYFAERVTSLGKDWHRPCLKCEKCGKTLTSGGHAEHEGKPYCNHPCYAAMFGPKGMLPTTLPDPALHSPWPPLTCPLPLCRLWARRSREPHFQVNPGFGDPSPAARWAAVLQADGRPFSTGTWGSPYRPPLPSINADTWKTCLCVCIPGATVQGCGQGPDARPRWHSLFLLLPALLPAALVGQGCSAGSPAGQPLVQLCRCAALLPGSGTGQQEQRATG